MTSIIFNNDTEILMKNGAINRGNRLVHKSNNIANTIPLSGHIKILKKNKQLYEINYNITQDATGDNTRDSTRDTPRDSTKDTDTPPLLKWYQLNPSNDQFVVQIKASFDNNNLIVKNVAMQELSGIKDVLLNI
uniref:Uncharacterized protein n=1 Tax=viral metagenome TaxID=1070528 RepID=A0A6C0I1V3_9ZZZZ